MTQIFHLYINSSETILFKIYFLSIILDHRIKNNWIVNEQKNIDR
jgi:hypothetical protein|uniref:Uncharacterized protein n=1 Tax=viral metagenome TaxID=1070528 RepID=A0A6C0BJ87_9ZZZZ